MEEQKRLFIAIILSIVVIFGWNIFFVDKEAPPKTSPEQAVTAESGTQTADQGKAVESVPAPIPMTASTVAPPMEPAPGSTGRTIVVDSPLYTMEISEFSGTVTSFKLKKYRETVEQDSPLKQMVSPKLSKGMFALDLEDKTVPGLENAVFRCPSEQDHIDVTQGARDLTFAWQSPQGLVVEKVFTMTPDSYLVGFNVTIKNGTPVPIKDTLSISIPGVVTEASGYNHEGPVLFSNDSLEEINVKKLADKSTFPGIMEWAGHTDRYFLTVIIPEKPVDATVKVSYEAPMATSRFVQSMDRIDPGRQITYPFWYFMGPKSLKIMGSLGHNLKKSENFGWFDVLARPCLIAMNFIYDLIPNYGVAIMLLTLAIKLLFWPLGTKSYKSMSDMKRIQPLMMQIREKYKGDKTKMNAEVMNLYKTYKVNPMSGCLPMLVQMPIFFALYRMLYQAIELRHAPFLGWINDLSAPDRLFNFDIAIPLMQAPYGIPVLTIIMGATMFLQQKMSPSTGDPTQAKMMMLMPIFMTFIFINFPSGLVLYWLVNNVLSIGQQYYIQKKFA
ncbi:MAG: membrane protein insertase YidC [Pseudomonadota bacterium]